MNKRLNLLHTGPLNKQLVIRKLSWWVYILYHVCSHTIPQGLDRKNNVFFQPISFQLTWAAWSQSFSHVAVWLHTHTDTHTYIYTQIPERLNLIPGSTGLSVTCGICLRLIDSCWTWSQRRVKNARAGRQVSAWVGVSVWQVRSEYKWKGSYLIAIDLSG